MSQAQPARGSFDYINSGGLVSLWANDAPLADILTAVGPLFGLHFDAQQLPERAVTCRYFDVTIDQLLVRLGVTGAIVMGGNGSATRLVQSQAVTRQPVAATPPSAWTEKVRSLIADLHDDNVRENGEEALWTLMGMGTAAVPALEYTLNSDDYQSRQFAAAALVDRFDYTPSDRFLQVLVEGLADDEYPMVAAPDDVDERPPYTVVYNAEAAYEYFRQNRPMLDRAEWSLALMLDSDDPQQRFLCALLLAEAGKTPHVARLAQILIPHLADNKLSSDGGLAAYALFRLGDRLRPYLAPYVNSTDQQQAELVNLILHHLDHPEGGNALLLPEDSDVSRSGDPVWVYPGISFYGWEPANFPAHQ